MCSSFFNILEKFFQKLIEEFAKEWVTVWDKETEKYYISIVDIISVLNKSSYQEARNYWKVLKYRLKEEENEAVTNCNQLKLKSQDGKYRSTDVCDIEKMLYFMNKSKIKV